MTITLAIIIITCLISISAFSNQKFEEDLIFYPPAITYRKQVYRFFTCGFIHANFLHLAVNMYGLYIFGENVEEHFVRIFENKGKLLYLLMYITALFFCLIPTYLKHKSDSSYRSLGASGAVSAVIFAYVMLNPLNKLGLLFLPQDFMLPGFIFGPLFIVLSAFVESRMRTNINHSAHITGALYGVFFLIITCYLLSDFPLVENFVRSVKYYFGNY